MHRRSRSLIEDADRFIATVPSDAVGVVFKDENTPVQWDLAALDT